MWKIRHQGHINFLIAETENGKKVTEQQVVWVQQHSEQFVCIFVYFSEGAVCCSCQAYFQAEGKRVV